MLKVGDKVIVVEKVCEDSAEIGTVGCITGIEEDWICPYEVDFDEEYLYDDSTLKLFEEKKSVEKDSGEARKFRVAHKPIYHEETLMKYLTTLIDEDNQGIWSGYTWDEPKYNATLSGFFRAMDYLGEKYEITVEYYE